MPAVLGEARGVVASACGYQLGVFGWPECRWAAVRRPVGGGGGARRLLQVCSQFDQQTAAAAAANAGLVVVGDEPVPAAGSGC